MTKEDKQLLLKDVCGRLPYKVMVHRKWNYYDEYDRKLKPAEKDDILEINDFYDICGIKPYLRPMSSMTEDESKELYNIRKTTHMSYSIEPKELDWLNAHHFDYRGLIPMGLALEAKEGMYK